jgi:lipopolysaccharide transport system ATP-binding protein
MSSDSDVAVRAQDLSKSYLLWSNPRDRLRQPMRDRMSRWFGAKPKQYYQQFWALKNVGFEVNRGETMGVIGRNGCGKSTLLQMLAGTLTPTTGTCSVQGRVSALLELGSGFNPEFTGRENVYLSSSILGLDKAETEERYPRIVEFADIGEYIDQPTKLYSSGMFMRLAFAVAINVDPDVLIVDEALAVGDAFFVQKCMRFMQRFRREHCLMFVSHDTTAVTGLCDRAILLDHGEIKAMGTAKEVCRLYLEERFGAVQSIDAVRSSTDFGGPLGSRGELDDDPVDQRLKYINASPLRNDIQVFRFDADSQQFGAAGARVTSVNLRDPETGAPLAWIVGGERVTLEVEVLAERPLKRAIVGFMVNDRLGQVVFSDNTYLTYAATGFAVEPGEVFVARFDFRMPLLPAGDYAIAASVAEGTQLDHVQLHWLHEALLFRSESSSVCTGMVGIPQRSIVMEIARQG